MLEIVYFKRTLFFVAVTLIFWLVTLRKPFVGVVYYQLFSMLMLQEVFQILSPYHIPKITALLTFIAWYFLKDKQTKITISKQTILMIAFLIVMCISSIVNGHEPWQVFSITFFFKLVIAHLLIINLINNEEKLWIFAIILPIAAADLATIANLEGTISPYSWMNKNHFGEMLVGSVAFAGMFAFHEKKLLIKLFWVFIVLTIFYGEVRSMSRGAFVGFTISIFLLFMLNFNIRNLLLLFLLSGIVMARANQKYINRIETIFKFEEVDTAQQRMGTASAGIKMFKANPFLGVGPDQFMYNFSLYASYEDQLKVGGNIGHEKIKPHNTFIQALSENGLIGFVLFILIIYYSIKDVFHVRRVLPYDNLVRIISEAAGISLIGLLITGLTINSAYSLQHYTLVSLITACRSLANKSIIFSNIIPQRYIILQFEIIKSSWYQFIVKHRLIFLIGFFVLCTYISKP